MSNQIEIKIEGRKLTPEKFLKAAQAFFDLIQGVAKNVVSIPVSWIAEVDKGSNVIRGRIENPTAESQKAIDLICRGVHALRTGVKAIPPGFTRQEVGACKILAELTDESDIRSISISIRNGGASEELSKSAVSAADAILSGENYTAFGSIEGRIDSLSDRRGFSCSVYEPHLQREITCYFQKNEVQEEAIKGFRKRVLAGGLIRYAKEGHPTSIVVDTIRIFPEESELPTVEEVQAIFKEYAK